MAYTNLPILDISSNTITEIQGLATEGSLINKYIPFKNLVNSDGEIIDFQTDNFKDLADAQTFNKANPINIEIQPSFDGSVNLILNNNTEKPKLINSRFSVQKDDTFKIVDHEGNRDSNLYDDTKLDLDTRLYKTINKIPTLTFDGILNGGKMLCGSYHFYFKLSDNDGNETDFIAESGVVTCHLGLVNSPNSIRMGMQNENSNKIVKFTLNNIDSSYDLIKVYYTRTTSDNSGQDIITAHYIDNDYVINGDKIELNITGYETHTDVLLSDINIFYEIVDSVKAQAQCQNMLFFGNVYKPDLNHTILEELSQDFIPTIVQNKNIGSLNSDYKDTTGNNLYEYYNANNIYYNLGYWPEEYYRLGIVYILNDYTLSPVFNVRGFDFTGTSIGTASPNNNKSNADDEGLLNSITLENIKGVIKLPKQGVIYDNGTKPLGISFSYKGVDIDKLKKYTKGCFLVRQERLPTIYAQGISINKTTNDYGNIPTLKTASGSFTQGFLDSLAPSDRTLEPNFVSTSNVEGKAAIIPEAVVKEELFNQLFTSTEFKLNAFYNNTSSNNLTNSNNNFYLENYPTTVNNTDLTDVVLTMVNDGLKLTTNGKDYFSAKAGDENQAWETIDVAKSWKTSNAVGINNYLSSSSSLVRGIFGTYVGLDKSLPFGTIFNIRSSNYQETIEYKLEMYKLRKNSSEPYSAITDRMSWDNFTTLSAIEAYRGDCYVCNFTHRIQRNFADPDLPTNNTIIDINTWKNNYQVYSDSETPAINRVLLNYKKKTKIGGSGTGTEPIVGSILEPSDAKYATAGTGLGAIFSTSEYSEQGASKINRSDVNAVPLGHWITVKVLSNTNLSMRDVDFSYPTEEAIHGKKRSFYPLENLSPYNKLPDSKIINGGSNVTLSKKVNFTTPNVPYIKNYFGNRIIYSDIATTDAFKNGYRVFKGGNYRDYTKVYGTITDIKEWYSNLFVTMEHGCLLIPVNERAVAAEGQGGMAYINTSNVLPENPKVVSDIFGSTWQESIIKTKTGIYGIDTVAKKIWKSDGQTLTCISDLKVQRFLNENIDLLESEKIPEVGEINVKSHYNKNKGDILFTFYNGTKEWNLCYNENLQKFITFYSWHPSYSANINNVFFSFDKNETTNVKIWKHGQSGLYANQNVIKPTYWYGDQHTFEFDFVITEIPTMQKIFNNLKLISNKAAPQSFEFEVVGETYDFYEVKDLIVWINNKVKNAKISDTDYSHFSTLKIAYKYILGLTMSEIKGFYLNFIKPFKMSDNEKFKKLPFLIRTRGTDLDSLNRVLEMNSTEVSLVEDSLLLEDRIHTQQLGNDIKKYGRLKGNMMYLEDLWNIEIRPITFKYAYLNANNVLLYTVGKEVRLRDKYIKVKVKYSGEDLAIIQGIKTIFEISYS